MMKILVCGGAGYIGSHMVRWLGKSGHDITVFDNLSTGHVESILGVKLVIGDLLNFAAIDEVLARCKFDLVIHFCAKAQVGESVSDPFLYYDNNVVGTLNLLKAMHKNNVNKLIFSSSCAIFGVPTTERITEDHIKLPVSPYGASKLMCERMIHDAALAYGLRSVCLRYFNAAGASPDGDIGESHDPETHLIPNILNSLCDPDSSLRLFGEDYPTKDGTCIRDYVHVDDLAYAHALSIDYMNDNVGAHAFNIGSECGASVLDIIQSVCRVTGKSVKYSMCERREGDPPSLIADSSAAKQLLGWTPKFDTLDKIIETAWKWHQSPKY